MGVYDRLSEFAGQARVDVLRMIYEADAGHPGGSLSVVEILTYLYCEEARPTDYVILSKGHACAAQYAILSKLAMIEREALWKFRRTGAQLQGHPSVRHVPQVVTSTGSLGQGLSVGVGMALGLRHKGSDARVYVVCGDGEMQEGIVWEAAMCAGHYGLGNLCMTVDYNRWQSDNLNENIMGIESLGARFKAFRWQAVEVANGHDFESLEIAYSMALQSDAPTAIIARTIKGKGVPFMEADPAKWHGARPLSFEEYGEAVSG